MKFHLDLRWANKKCKLVDGLRNQVIPLKLEATNKDNLNLALLTFKQYSQEKSAENSKIAKKPPIPSRYQKIIDAHPDVLKVTFLKEPLHGVVHDIPTGNNKPCKAICRPIMAGTEKAIKAEATWRQLEKMGVVEKVKAGDPTLWSSPLHIAKKSDGSLRPCGDYRSLNALTEHDSYPLPTLKTHLAKIKGRFRQKRVSLFGL